MTDFKKTKLSLLVVFCCVGVGSAKSPLFLQQFVLPPTRLDTLGAPPFNASDLATAKANGLRFDDLPSIGSGLALIADREFFGISDRGPNGVVEVDGAERRTFPLPKFCPFIARFKLADGKIQILETLLLRDGKGKPLTGLSNSKAEGRLYESARAKHPLPLDPNGVDPEGLRVFPDGKFLMSEEYGPSILVVSSNGTVLVRYTPASKPLRGAGYPVQNILPEVLAQRRDNRGFEALALSPDGRTAYAMLQSAAGEAREKRFKRSRVSRAIRLDLTDPLHARVTGHFLMPLSAAAAYGPEQNKAEPKLNDAEWLAPDQLLVLEQGRTEAHLIVADFSAATNLQGRPDENSLEFEAAGANPDALPVQTAHTEVWASTAEFQLNNHKLEGLAVLSATEIALANDNDFGLGDNETGEPSSVWILQLPRPLPLRK